MTPPLDSSPGAKEARARPFDAAAFAAELGDRFRTNDALALLRAAIIEVFPGRIAAVSSFGAESAALLSLVAEIDRAVPVIFLDTGQHFPETLAYRDELVRCLGLTDMRIVRPEPAALARHDRAGRLWASTPDRCCSIRKVLPLERALTPFRAWISGLKRYHGGARTTVERVESEGSRVKINPLADWPESSVKALSETRDLPAHPLTIQGYRSIGCAPCTIPAGTDDTPRTGRWAGRAKTECGIHFPYTMRPDWV